MEPNFNYDISDVDRFAGLKRPWDQEVPYLTPVLFNKEVLVRYFYDPRYRCRFFSETYGQVSDGDGDFAIPFGITPASKVVFWLGDLQELPESEQRYLIAENVPSDHSIESEFYDAQIEAQFPPEPILEIEVLLLKTRINDASSSKLGISIFKTANRSSIGAIVGQCSRYKRITYGSEDDFKRFVSEWNEQLVEDINIQDIKGFLDAHRISYEAKIRENKTLEVFIRQFLGVPDNIIAPLFYLNDLRHWAVHPGGQGKYNTVLANMGVPANSAYGAVYRELMSRLYEFLQTLLSRIVLS